MQTSDLAFNSVVSVAPYVERWGDCAECRISGQLKNRDNEIIHCQTSRNSSVNSILSDCNDYHASISGLNRTHQTDRYEVKPVYTSPSASTRRSASLARHRLTEEYTDESTTSNRRSQYGPTSIRVPILDFSPDANTATLKTSMVGDQKGTKESGGRRILISQLQIPFLGLYEVTSLENRRRTFFNEDSTRNGQSQSLKSTTGNRLPGKFFHFHAQYIYPSEVYAYDSVSCSLNHCFWPFNRSLSSVFSS
ncbi:hypothetical protein P879_01055 [Paragonimus westermani]|uniref:Uncharacterized protein n=1 Tax=Paragonimus westermani TaxID=34504 RepID=A0A8T0DIW5_9TREM|nr:hypothetical protein P879_01055 [Paragonimus westermani]